ncbi:reprolysin-like metallopeptidase [Pelagibaculum spongiae]|uniref:Peptidase M12B domain-containing protein n=1 Tax=Pelagibaculum spongiae TaxID=2080658 RepID=A0A2V1GXR2_9GAMM|nr:zinc-dependent metalloprotease family protein [Pelagibaculum spongiae]PVZ71951.1 hypothetical protein DC094_02705 [Pelagibaculum spongiae]
MLKKWLLACAIVPCAHTAQAASIWTDQDNRIANKQSIDTPISTSGNERFLTADIAQLRQQLSQPGLTKTILELPIPEGGMIRFEVKLDSIMAPELASEFPKIRTFKGHQIGNPSNVGRFDITPQGFHAMFSNKQQLVYIDPVHVETDKQYKSYRYLKPSNRNFSDRVIGELNLDNIQAAAKDPQQTSTSDLRKFRIAVAASGEYTQFHGGTVSKGMAAVTTAINRVNQLYQRDLSIKLELVAGNQDLIFTNKRTDPFDNTSYDIDEAASAINSRISSNSYDIGHVFNTGGGGLASLGSVCGRYKAEGITGSDQPTGDAFHVDYVAHEIGHQFGAEHTFNGTLRNCSGDNRSDSSAYEPGSGSTIMAYAGICEDDDLQRNSDPYFHTRSISQINTFVRYSGTCFSKESYQNTKPSSNAGKNYIIPANTPFRLEGSATDLDNDQLSYSWEQYDTGVANSNLDRDRGNGPIFRVWPPKATPVRYLPRLEDVINGITAKGETYPTTSRTLNFRLVTRDGKGGVSYDSSQITVRSGSGFEITSPESSVSWTAGSQQSVSWNVAQTNRDPINCSSVDIKILKDIESDPILITQAENNGAALFTVPNITTTNARLMVSCSDNIFFAITKSALRITGSTNNQAPQVTGQKNIIEVISGQSFTISPSQLTIKDSDSDNFTAIVKSGDNYTVSGTRVTPDNEFTGTLSIPVQVSDGQSSSNIFNMTIEVFAPLSITGQTKLTFESGKALTISTEDLQLSGTSTGIQYTLNILPGNNYNVSGTTITATNNFFGILTIPVKVSGNQQTSALFNLKVQVTVPVIPLVITGQSELTVESGKALTLSVEDLQLSGKSTSVQYTLNILPGNNYNVSGTAITADRNFSGTLTVPVEVSGGQKTSALFNLKVQVTAPVIPPVIPLVITGQSDLTVESGKTLTLSVEDLQLSGKSTSVQYTLNILPGNNYSVVSNTITASSSFSGFLTVPVEVSGGEQTSSRFDLQVSVTKPAPVDPEPTDPGDDDKQSGGGSLPLWALALLLLPAFRRK